MKHSLFLCFSCFMVWPSIWTPCYCCFVFIRFYQFYWFVLFVVWLSSFFIMGLGLVVEFCWFIFFVFFAWISFRCCKSFLILFFFFYVLICGVFVFLEGMGIFVLSRNRVYFLLLLFILRIVQLILSCIGFQSPYNIFH